jgi:hypothetical protein
MDRFFKKHSYTVLKNFIDKSYLKWAVKYYELKFNILRDHYTTRVDEYGHSPEPVMPIAKAYYGDPMAEILLLTLTPKVEKVVGKNLFPTYTYSRFYQAGQYLRKHTDRESCEYSITCPLTSLDWPLIVNDKEINLSPGDVLIYKGRELPHYRNTLKSGSVFQLHLHWVDQEGPYKDFKFDKRPAYLASQHPPLQ